MDPLPTHVVGGESSSPQPNFVSRQAEGRQRIILFFLKPGETFQGRLSVFKKNNKIPKNALGSWTEVIDPIRNQCDIYAWCQGELLRGVRKLVLFRNREEYHHHTRMRGKKIKIVLRFGYTGYHSHAKDFDILLEENVVQ